MKSEINALHSGAGQGNTAGMTNTLLSLGHGYSASALARVLIPQGWQIIGTTRSPEKAARLAAQGIEPVIWPGTALAPSLAPYLARATHLLTSIAPGETGDQIGRAHV